MTGHPLELTVPIRKTRYDFQTSKMMFFIDKKSFDFIVSFSITGGII